MQPPDTPLASPAQIIVVNSPNDCNAVLEAHVLTKDIRLVGLDTETRVFVAKGPTRPVAIIQLATTNVVIIVQIFQIWLRYNFIPERLVSVLSDPLIAKCGVAMSGDVEKLQVLYGLRVRGIVDIESAASARGLGISHSLSELAKYFYGNNDPAVADLRSLKNRKFALQINWEAEVLSPDALNYAATDALMSAKLLSSVLTGTAHPDHAKPELAVMTPTRDTLKEAAIVFFGESKKRMGEYFPTTDPPLVNMLANSCRDFALLPDKRASAETVVNQLHKDGFFSK
jgi:hypothetical protein